MKKIQCHPKYSVIIPPTPYPSDRATVVASEMYPNTLPLTILGKLTEIIAGVMESNIAEPTPCRILEMINCSIERDIPEK